MSKPNIPEPTCPTIDRVISDVADALWEAKAIARYSDCEIAKKCADMIDRRLDGVRDRMEQLRQANSELRDGLRYYQSALIETQDEVAAAMVKGDTQ